MKPISGIYCFEFPNGKLYIGQSKNIDNRWRRHKSNANKGEKGYVYDAIRKYGWNKIKKYIIEKLPPTADLNEREKYWIKEFKSRWEENGYNLTDGGDGAQNLSESSVKKRSDKLKGRSSWNKGKSMPAETRKKISQSHKGKPRSEETRKKLSKMMKERQISDEMMQKMKKNKGKKIYNNGYVSKAFGAEESIPGGFVLGRLPDHYNRLLNQQVNWFQFEKVAIKERHYHKHYRHTKAYPIIENSYSLWDN
jgi:group I intron endonuclease